MAIPVSERGFPTLTAAQLSRLRRQGRCRSVNRGEVLYEAGAMAVPMFVVVSGELTALRRTDSGDTPMATHFAGQFSGEINIIKGSRALATLRAGTTGEVIELQRQQVLELLQNDAELSEIMLTAFLERRVGIVSRDLGDVAVIGRADHAGTLRVREFLTRSGHPFRYLDLDRDADAAGFLSRASAAADDIPLLICRGTVLRDPTAWQIADCLGFNQLIHEGGVVDVAIVGAGPAGLAAAVYATSEGLDAMVIESHVPGGQAGASSRIENYLGFPSGISGLELTTRAHAQALKFGTQIMVARRATQLQCNGSHYTIQIDDTHQLHARTVVIATGGQYRKPPIANLATFENAGVYYNATATEAQMCEGQEVAIIGAGNAAGQAAVFLAATARRVHLLVRGPDMAETMSRYLIRRIQDNPSIVVHLRTQLVAAEGTVRLERIRWQSEPHSHTETRDICRLFIMTGAIPNTVWLKGLVAVDEQGFVKTGRDLSANDLAKARWPLTRPPYPFETNRPGIFAVGDVRAGNIKRVASAVGEGSIAVTFVHQSLHH